MADWLDGFDFAITGMVILDYVDKGIAEGYRDFFRDLADTHSKCR